MHALGIAQRTAEPKPKNQHCRPCAKREAPAAFGLEHGGDPPHKNRVADAYPMNHHEEAPKLSKLPFIVGDLALLGAAALIANRSANPITPSEMLAITLCVVLGAALLVIPFLVNYARRQDAVLSDRQNQITALARTTAESAEQISIAVAGIHTLVSSLPKPVAPAPAPAPSDDPIVRRLAQLDAAAKTQSDTLAAREKALAAALSHATRQIEVLVTATAQVIAAGNRPLELPASPTPAPATAALPSPADLPATTSPVTVTSPVPSPIPTIAETPSPATIPTSETPANTQEPTATLPQPAAFTAAEPQPDQVPVDDAPKPPKAPRQRKPKSADAVLDLGLTTEEPEPMQSAPTADGFTRLIATAYIGIGQKLYLRGDGPGLSWEKGVPLQFVSIGKWLWQTADANAPFSAKLYKNDQVECTGLGEITLEPGSLNEVNAGFCAAGEKP